MKRIITVVVCGLGLALGSCEQTQEDKRQGILENKLENAATQAELTADSLQAEAQKLEEMAKSYEQEANKIKDSLKSL